MRRSASILVLGALALAGCGDDGREPSLGRPESAPRTLVAALGDSITAGSPLWDPDPEVRITIPRADPDSQYERWAERRAPRLRFRNCGVLGERTDEIARRLDSCTRGARAVVLQGGVNDIAQGRGVRTAARNLDAMAGRARRRGLRVVLVELLPWNGGYPTAAPRIRALNRLIRAIGRRRRLRVLPWYRALEDPRLPGRMPKRYTGDGSHPSPAGYMVLGGLAAEALQP